MKPSGWFIHPQRAIRDQVRFDRLLSAGPTIEVPLTTLGFGGGGDDMNDPFDAAAQVHASAREWHKLQLGVLGFVGLCGVLRDDAGSGRPLWLQDLSGITALAGLVLALVAVTLVATVAFPLVAVPGNPPAIARRLRLGIGVTFCRSRPHHAVRAVRAEHVVARPGG